LRRCPFFGVGRQRHLEVNDVWISSNNSIHKLLLFADVLIGVGNPAAQIVEAVVLSPNTRLFVVESRHI
jgi:hypothetical protein